MTETDELDPVGMLELAVARVLERGEISAEAQRQLLDAVAALREVRDGVTMRDIVRALEDDPDSERIEWPRRVPMRVASGRYP